jgi:hypothetical protein
MSDMSKGMRRDAKIFVAGHRGMDGRVGPDMRQSVDVGGALRRPRLSLELDSTYSDGHGAA